MLGPNEAHTTLQPTGGGYRLFESACFLKKLGFYNVLGNLSPGWLSSAITDQLDVFKVSVDPVDYVYT